MMINGYAVLFRSGAPSRPVWFVTCHNMPEAANDAH